MAKTVVQELVVAYTGDTKELQAASDNAKKAVTGVREATQGASVSLATLNGKAVDGAKGLNVLAGAATSAKAGITSLIPVLAGPAAITAAIVAASASAFHLASDLRDMSDATGASIESLQELRFVGMDAGLSIQQTDTAVTTFSRNIGDAYRGVGALADTLDELGIAIKDPKGGLRDFDDILDDVANRIKSTKNAQEQLSIATDFFGKQAAPGMVRALNGGSAALDDMRQKAHDLGTVISSEAVIAADEINKKFEILAYTISTSLKAAIVGLIGDISTLAGAFNDLGKFEIKFDQVGLENQRKAFAEKIDDINSRIAAASKATGLSAGAGVAALREEASAYAAEIEKIDALLAKRGQGLPATNPKGVGNSPGPTPVSPVTTKTAATAKAAVDTVTGSVEKMNNSLSTQIELLSDIRKDAASTFSDFARSVAGGENALDALKNKALDVIGSIAESMMNMAFGGGSGSGIGGLLAGFIGNAVGLTTTALSGPMAGQQVIPTFANGAAFSHGRVQKFASGTVINKATAFPMSTGTGVMGEAGPEAIMPLTRGADGKLGVRSSGGGQQLTQNINVSVGVAQTVRAEMARMLPQFRAVALGAVQDAQKRRAL